MAITINTSALLAVLLNEEHKEEIVEHTKGYDLQAPASLDAEVGKALSAMFKRDRLALDKAKEVVKQFKQIPIRRTKLRLAEALKLANAYNIYAYDAYVLDCAKQYRTPLLSLDSKEIEIAKKLGLTVLEVSK